MSGTAELSPAQHARIRLHLALVPAYVGFAADWVDLARRIAASRRGLVVTDFIGIYLDGLIALRHDAAALYDMTRRSALLNEIAPGAGNLRYPPFYGPQLSMVFSPLARLPYRTALDVWMACSLGIYIACGLAVWSTCARLRDNRAATTLLLLGNPALYYLLGFGQISAVALLCVTLAFFALRANRPFLGGLAIGSLAYKPTLALVFAIVWIGASMKRGRSEERWLVAGVFAAAAAQFVAAAMFWGPAMIADYLRAQTVLVPDMRDQFYVHHLHSWRSFFEILGLPGAVAIPLYIVFAAVSVAVALRAWLSGAPTAVRFAILLIATVVASPHIYVYDLVILMPAYLLLWDAFGGAKAIEWLLYLSYFAPRFAIVALVAHVQLSVPALTTLGLMVTKAEKPRGVPRTIGR